jgi:hypothetical protein
MPPERSGKLTRRASDGSILYMCTNCSQYKKPTEFATKDAIRGYTCRSCNMAARLLVKENESESLCLRNSNWHPKNRKDWEQAIWKHLTLFSELKKPYGKQRIITLEGIRKGDRGIIDRNRKGLISLLCTEDMKGTGYFWVAFLPNLLSEEELRSFILGVVKYAIVMSGLDKLTDMSAFITGLRYGYCDADGGLNKVKRLAYSLIEKFEEEYNPIPAKKTVHIILEACLPVVREAAIRVIILTIEMLIIKYTNTSKEEITDETIKDLQKVMCAILNATYSPKVVQEV